MAKRRIPATRSEARVALLVKTAGYGVSTLSVLLLGAVAWDGAAKHGWSLAALVVGMAASILGMGCRLWTYWQDKEHDG